MPNRLAHESSPYLLQHADNPVDWYPWGADAFERSRRESKPIFLSIGYSTCHWCHVMEHESFMNDETARVLNELFVPVKVDREERPDVDRVYMTALQMMTGGGGWPMSMFLTPELAPFYGGTYYPPTDLHGRPGFRTVLERISQFWREEQEQAIESGRQMIEMLNERPEETTSDGDPDAELLDAAYTAIAAEYDRTNGGFGRGAKFPRPVVLAFLFRTYKRTGNPEALAMALTTLRAMARGGMMDHLGGGFHRYSVDAEWRVPHFEKMLYDQAQLVYAYVDAWKLTGDEFFARTARETINYVLRDLRDKHGAFVSAEDADSLDSSADAPSKEAREGAFYVWTKNEIDAVLTPEEARIFCALYQVEPGGNVKADPHHEFQGRNILAAASTGTEAAVTARIDPDAAARLLESSRKKLFERRATRPRPFRDNKVIAAWNGQMIAALAHASVALGQVEYREEAVRAAHSVIDRLYDPATKTLRRIALGEETRAEAHLEDYSCMVDAMLELYAATGGEEWLVLAKALTGTQETLFWDAVDGGFFETSGKDPSVLARMKTYYDGAEPAGNSVAAMNLVRLARLTAMPGYQMRARTALRSMIARIGGAPQSMPLMLCAVDAWLNPDAPVCAPEGCTLR